MGLLLYRLLRKSVPELLQRNKLMKKWKMMMDLRSNE